MTYLWLLFTSNMFSICLWITNSCLLAFNCCLSSRWQTVIPAQCAALLLVGFYLLTNMQSTILSYISILKYKTEVMFLIWSFLLPLGGLGVKKSVYVLLQYELKMSCGWDDHGQQQLLLAIGMLPYLARHNSDSFQSLWKCFSFQDQGKPLLLDNIGPYFSVFDEI